MRAGNALTMLWLASMLGGCIGAVEGPPATSATCEASGRFSTECRLVCERGVPLRASATSAEGVQVFADVMCGGVATECWGETSCETPASEAAYQRGDDGICYAAFPRVVDRWRTISVACGPAGVEQG